jgi:hypothetical protein
MACDYGESFLTAYPDSPACAAIKHVVRRVGEEMGLAKEDVLPDDE